MMTPGIFGESLFDDFFDDFFDFPSFDDKAIYVTVYPQALHLLQGYGPACAFVKISEES